MRHRPSVVIGVGLSLCPLAPTVRYGSGWLGWLDITIPTGFVLAAAAALVLFGVGRTPVVGQTRSLLTLSFTFLGFALLSSLLLESIFYAASGPIAPAPALAVAALSLFLAAFSIEYQSPRFPPAHR
ncbi:hypothetical protein [Haloarchaeobius sp. DFWS5]|uniref:hypothetical protein n=1 Tax=Haloarchaeobius sp. DFWS5 TaxID=3446114 RepID=UPI003EBE04EC